MATLSAAFVNAYIDGGTALVQSVALMDDSNVEVTRVATTVPASAGGSSSITEMFTVPGGSTVANFACYDAASTGNQLVSGALPTAESYTGEGDYELTINFTG